MKMKSFLLAIVVLSVSTQVSAKDKGDPVNGEKLAAQGYCYTCHGDKGIPPSRNAPPLAGQSVKYFVKTLEEYQKKGILLDYKSLGMQGIVQPMTKKDMNDLASFYASQELPAKGNSGPLPKIVDENCSDCHIEDGKANKKKPGLGGMTAAYIKRQVNAYKNGKRTDKKMDPDDLNKLSDEQLDVIYKFYSTL